MVKGLFEVVRRVFGMKVRERLGIDTWHPDVRFYDIFDADDELRGSFYLDPTPASTSRGSLDGRLPRSSLPSGRLAAKKPVAYLTCNFNGPVDGKPALFTHNEVVTLFHEFGHGIHHMLTRVDVAGWPASTAWPGTRWSCRASSSRTGAGSPRPWPSSPVIMKQGAAARRICWRR